MSSTLTPGSEVTVRLVKQPPTAAEPREKVSYLAMVLADDGIHLAVRAPWAGAQTRDMGFVKFEEGDVFTEHYWRDRWYSIKEVRTDGGLLKGWYCDIARPAAVRDGVLVVEDLDLDLWLSADGDTILRLDEDEFLASGLAERDPAAARRARQALDELAAQAPAGFAALLDIAGA
jgi:hypothetical protein